MKTRKGSSKICHLRPIGQRSITSTFLFRASLNRDCERDVEFKVPIRKVSRPSLSNFLSRKLHKSSVLPTSVQITVLCRRELMRWNAPFQRGGKCLPFSSPLSDDHLDRGAETKSVKMEGLEAERKLFTDGAFSMFKNIEKGKDGSRNSSSANDTEIFYVDDIQQTRKRRKLNEGQDNKPTIGKRLVVLGEDTKPIQMSKRNNFIPLFNHYGNGGGWWNDNMEGVDNEEVGCSDAWEGVGCTTLGGIEWH
ncbi:hypothetical protein OROGR_025486 [Orobanche gracilis]